MSPINVAESACGGTALVPRRYRAPRPEIDRVKRNLAAALRIRTGDEAASATSSRRRRADELL